MFWVFFWGNWTISSLQIAGEFLHSTHPRRLSCRYRLGSAAIMDLGLPFQQPITLCCRRGQLAVSASNSRLFAKQKRNQDLEDHYSSRVGHTGNNLCICGGGYTCKWKISSCIGECVGHRINGNPLSLPYFHFLPPLSDIFHVWVEHLVPLGLESECDHGGLEHHPLILTCLLSHPCACVCLV